MTLRKKIRVGISIGDLNGVGLEVVLKTFRDKRMMEFSTPVLFGSSKALSYHKKILDLNVPVFTVNNLDKIADNKINLMQSWEDEVNIEFGQASKEVGSFAFRSLQAATTALKDGQVDVLVTAPINKDSIYNEDFKFPGHTEYLGVELEGDALMLLVCEELRVGLITGHVPISEVSDIIDEELISRKVSLMNTSLKKDFGIDRPKIAVLGINPHCGDKGVIGNDDENIVRPALEKINKEQGILVYGPYAADGFFGSRAYENFDGVLAMYHDQGLAPFKTIAFGTGVNFTAGLNKIRTSPDHGTGFDIAGKGLADESSFKAALFKALELFANRSNYEEITSNVLKTKR
jgi:4-hydroxythreonine-4-phosphate dehydrogenase